MSRLGVKGPVSDGELIRRRFADHEKAYGAAWIALSEDRRFMGAPRYKKLICEVAALRAVGSQRTMLKEITLAYRKDQKGAAMLQEGYDRACKAAAEAIGNKPMDIL